MTVIVCAPEGCSYRAIKFCPVCERRRRFVVRVWEWYPAIFTCVGCGDEWSEDGRQPRPFRRGWRADAIAAAREAWNEATTFAEAMKWLMAQLDRSGVSA